MVAVDAAGLTTRVDAMVAAVTAVAGQAAQDKPITRHTQRNSAHLAAKASVQMRHVATQAPMHARKASEAVDIVTAVIGMTAIAVVSVMDRAAATAVAAKVADTVVVRVTPATEVAVVIPATEAAVASRAVRVPVAVATVVAAPAAAAAAETAVASPG